MHFRALCDSCIQPVGTSGGKNQRGMLSVSHLTLGCDILLQVDRVCCEVGPQRVQQRDKVPAVPVDSQRGGTGDSGRRRSGAALLAAVCGTDALGEPHHGQPGKLGTGY